MVKDGERQKAINFLALRYGLDDVSFTYDKDFYHKYGMKEAARTKLETGDVIIGPKSFQSSSVLRKNMVHEYGHSTFDRVFDLKTGNWNWASEATAANYSDGSVGYGCEILNSGKMHIRIKDINFIMADGNAYNPLWGSYGLSKYYNALPRRFFSTISNPLIF